MDDARQPAKGQTGGHLLRGAAMGVADLVPGVSGGTIAFVLGFHRRLVTALAAWGPSTPAVFYRALRGDEEARDATRRHDLPFLLPLGLGLVAAILLGSRVIEAALEDHPVAAMGVFTGLLAASSILPWRARDDPAPSHTALLAAGIAAAAVVALLPSGDVAATPLVVLAAGAIAISAMLLPGISGSGLLLIMGLYEPIVAAVSALDLRVMAPFAAGAAIGLMVASRALRALFDRAHDATLAVLTGLVLGAIVRVWPWRSEAGFAAGRPSAPHLEVAWLWILLGAALVAALHLAARRAGASQQA
ncbi:MAG: DUF368 domain-containing protein [Thermoplasmatota archaeon]